MIAAFVLPTSKQDPTPTVHVIYGVAQEGLLHVHNYGYCGAKAKAGDGVVQIPDWVFDGRTMFANQIQNQNWRVCPACTQAIKTLREPPR
jgi:hypothetical protein